MRQPPADSPARARAERVKRRALALGFDDAGVCDLRPIERAALDRWLAGGHAGAMAYMHRQARRRREPARIVAGATRAVVVLKSYFQNDRLAGAAPARVARYAWGEDYHRVVGERLAQLAEEVLSLGGNPARTRCYVDAGPVPERELAARAGLGWMAKNTMLIHPRLGSFTFIGAVLTDLDLDPDPPFAADHCGSCRLCLEACPTDAFPTARVLDARRCISYLTIEWHGPFDAVQRESIGDWLFGCDVCQDVCPWNDKFSVATAEPRFAPRLEVLRPNLDELAHLEEETFRARYGDTALERTGANGLARNARAVAENGLRRKNDPSPPRTRRSSPRRARRPG
jgi:epoxyqueuosine reductase